MKSSSVLAGGQTAHPPAHPPAHPSPVTGEGQGRGLPCDNDLRDFTNNPNGNLFKQLIKQKPLSHADKSADFSKVFGA